MTATLDLVCAGEGDEKGAEGGVAGDRDELVQRGEGRGTKERGKGRRRRQWLGRMKGLLSASV